MSVCVKFEAAWIIVNFNWGNLHDNTFGDHKKENVKIRKSSYIVIHLEMHKNANKIDRYNQHKYVC